MIEWCDMFVSVQGEGSFSGTPCLFLRLHGCNLKCSFCDESLHKQKKTLKQDNAIDLINLIKEKLRSYKHIRHIVISGGEPSLQYLNNLISMLHVEKYFVQVESNGYNIENIRLADFITISPKNLPSVWDQDAKLLSLIGELKLPYPCDNDELEMIEARVKSIESWKPIKWVTPINDFLTINKENNKKAFEFVLSNPSWRLNIQAHKVWEIA